jgi:hypothetical protein
MRRIRTTIMTLLLAGASLLSGAPSSSATPTATPAPFGPAVTLLPRCGTLQAADAAIAVDGTVRGYATCGPWQAPVIWFFRYQGGSVFAQPTPYHGKVVKVAWDDLNNTYLLFTRPGPGTLSEQLVIGKRLENTGQYAPTTLLTTTYPAGLKKYLAPIQAGLVASKSRWWAVWTQPTRPAPLPPEYALFERHTLLYTQPWNQMTYPSGQDEDFVPSLAYSSGRMTAVWLRGDSATSRGRLTLGLNTGHGWTARSLPATSPVRDPIGYPDLIQYAGVRHLAWLGTAAVGVASDILRSFTPHFLPASKPPLATIAVSGQNLFVLWSGSGAVFAERRAGSWTPATVVAGSSAAVRVLAQGGRARLAYWSADALMLREQT